MTEAAAFRRARRALLLAGAAACLPARAQRVFRLGLLAQGDDGRYSPQVLLQGFPDAPSGRSAPAAELGLNDGLMRLQLSGLGAATLVPVQAPDAPACPRRSTSCWGRACSTSCSNCRQLASPPSAPRRRARR